MNGEYLLDTNIIIYAINRELTLTEGRYSISVITEMELLSYSGLSSTEASILADYLHQMTIFPLDDPIKQRAIEIRRETSLKLPDSIISSTALMHEKCLVSNDTKLTSSHPGSAITLEDLIG
ncbi:type II toxin-antitoxin system VapC family toxin [Halospina sp. K52047b]|uniref:type II toxin-antitoxin system VapC family toxin n=1 Tax=Halospina sp. K52047b TaxID=2614160 RepID=UPI001249C728|nr:type II toxin-antitoxin system VapC family toxin [Halospina sp. K52047b]KAA8978319.1 type II toxin-antitoxin system VapC family toxin [Halospina sp. K52047b]